MKLLKKIAFAAAIAMSFAGTASASTEVLTDWHFSPNGTGIANSEQVNEYLDITGNGFIQLSTVGAPAGTFNFMEHGVFTLPFADNSGVQFASSFAGGNISIMFEASGTGTFNGEFQFGGGTIKMYQNPTNNQYGTAVGIYGANQGNLIANFNVYGGGGKVDGTGAPLGNGDVSVFAKADFLKAGYFFNPNGTSMVSQDIFSFAFTGANGVSNPRATLVSELVCQFSAYAGPGCGGGVYSNVPGNHFIVSNSGSFKLATEVPEPGSLALFGLAILGAGFASRKRKQA